VIFNNICIVIAGDS